jgi:hypothetical protein
MIEGGGSLLLPQTTFFSVSVSKIKIFSANTLIP